MLEDNSLIISRAVYEFISVFPLCFSITMTAGLWLMPGSNKYTYKYVMLNFKPIKPPANLYQI